MPNCFQLCRDGEPVRFTQIDEEMCLHFGEPCDPDRYFRCWYDFIGFDLAMGKSFAEIKAIYATPEWADLNLAPVAEWLEAHFTPRSWYEPSSVG